MKKITAGIFVVFLCAQTAYGMKTKPPSTENVLTKLFDAWDEAWGDARKGIIPYPTNRKELVPFIKKGEHIEEVLQKMKKDKLANLAAKNPKLLEKIVTFRNNISFLYSKAQFMEE